MPKSRPSPDPQGHPGAVALPWLPAMQPPTVEAALRDVDSAKPRFRRDSAFALRRAEGGQTAPAVEALRRLLEDRDAVVRALAVESLGVLGDGPARDAVAKLVEDADPGVRAAAVDALGELAQDDDRSLRSLLSNGHPDVRARACAVLGEAGGDGVEELLAGALKDADAGVRASAVAALGWWYPRRRAEELRNALSDADGDVRLSAADALAFAFDDAGRDVLRTRVEAGPNDEAWNHAFSRLCRIASADDRPLLTARAGWPNRRVRRALALAGLARMGDTEAARRLKEWLAHRDPRRRGEALLAVGFARATGLADAVAAELRRPESPLFETAQIAAVQLGDAGLSDALVETARATADRGVFEELATTAGDLVRLLGADAPQALHELSESEFQAGRGGTERGEGDAPDA
jgi:HEAT repeat protein